MTMVNLITTATTTCLCWILLVSLYPSSSLALSPLTSTRPSKTRDSRSSAHHHQQCSRTKIHLVAPGSSLQPEQPKQPRQTRWTEYITPDIETPTLIQQSEMSADIIPPRPKVVVFGASGKIGRRIIKKLMSASNVDIDVVAFVRDKQKLDTVLYDEEDLVLDNLMDGRQDRGPRLHVLVGDIVSRTDVYRGTFETEDETRLLNDWVGKAKEFFNSKGWNTDDNTAQNPSTSSSNRINSLQDEKQIENDVRTIEAGDEALQEAISGATIIISCLSSLRYSNLWVDYLKVPILRVFRNDASKWCSDSSHPYYINYLSTKKILEVAEREQLKRDAYNEFERERLLLEEQLQRGRRKMMGGDEEEEEEGFETEIAAGLRKKRGTRGERRNLFAGEGAVDLPANGVTPSSTDRIKFIRISHSIVGRNPFRLLSIFYNVFRSQMTRFEFLGEKLLTETKLIDTIILRPGEVTDIERDRNNTSLQLCIDGNVPTPNLGLVGRDDIADLAVVAALTTTSSDELSTTSTTNSTTSSLDSARRSQYRPHHYVWSMRWTGDGLSTAALCFVKAIKNEKKLLHLTTIKEKRYKQYHGGKTLLALQKWRKQLRPHALSVALTVYLAIGATAWYFFGSSIVDLALKARKHKWLKLMKGIL